MMAFENDHDLTADGVGRAVGVEGADRAVLAGTALHLRLHVRTVSEGIPEDHAVAQRQDGLSGPGQHRYRLGADRHGHLRRLRAPARHDDERHQPRRQPLQRPGSRRSATSTAATPCTASSAPSTASRRATAASRCRLHGRPGVPLHPDRHAGPRRLSRARRGRARSQARRIAIPCRRP